MKRGVSVAGASTWPRPEAVEMRLIGDTIWMLVTQFGGNDPEGKGGCVHVEFGGSGCRWVEYDPTEHEGSKERWRAAKAFHEGQGTHIAPELVR